MAEPSTVSRRGLLAGVGGLVAAGAAAGLTPDRVRPEQRLDASVPPDSWPLHKHDPSRTGYQSDPGPRTEATLEWRTEIGRDPTAAPGVAATPDRVFTVGATATVALAPDNGEVAWRTRHRERGLVADGAGEFVQAGPQLVGDRVLTVADVTLRALRRADGDGDWAYGTNSSFRDVLAAGNTVFLGSLIGDADRLVALSAGTGLPYWRQETTARPLAHAPDADLLVTVRRRPGNDGGALQARDPRTGAIEWTADAGPVPDSTLPAVADGTLFVADEPVTAIDVADGTERWQAPSDGTGIRGPVTDGDRVYVTTEQGVAAFDTGSGEERWTTDLPVGGFATSALAADRLYVPTDAGVAALASGDGSVAFEATVPGGRPTGLAVAGGRLYARTERGVVALEGSR